MIAKLTVIQIAYKSNECPVCIKNKQDTYPYKNVNDIPLLIKRQKDNNYSVDCEDFL